MNTLETQFKTMLDLQNRMNTKVHPEWIAQRFEWYRALWIECAELIEHYGYKWWKKQTPDMEQVKLEVVDIWHFGLSMLFDESADTAQIAAAMCTDLKNSQPSGAGVRESTEALACETLQSRSFSVPLFWDLLLASDMDAESLYRAYIGKNVLNFFRQDHGYKSGEYVKQWQGREDNEHLVEIVEAMDSSAENFADQLYRNLAKRYQDVLSR